MCNTKDNPALIKLKRRLENAGLYYLQRYTSSKANFEAVMRRKIDKWELQDTISATQISELLTSLIQKFEDLRYINDQQYALMKIRSGFTSGKSKRWIEQYLAQKSIGKEDFTIAYERFCSEINSDNNDDFHPDHEAALKYAQKKRLGPYATNKAITPELLQKHLARLVRAGFSFHLAKKILSNPQCD